MRLPQQHRRIPGGRAAVVGAQYAAGGGVAMIMRLLFLILVLPLAVTLAVAPVSTANAEEMRPELSVRQTEIVKTVQSVEGYIDKELYDEFWALMPAEIRDSPSNRKMLIDFFSEVSDEREKFMAESWLSAKASLAAKRIVRTEGYIAAQMTALNASANSGYQSKIPGSIASGERLIAAAANGTPLDTPGGKTFITSDLIERVLSGIEASEFRVAKLVSPSWDGLVIEFRYPEAHVSILAKSPFVLERTKVKSSEGREVELVILSQRINMLSHQMISFSDAGGSLLYPSKSVISIAKAGITGAGATAITHTASIDWRGRTSATAMGSAKTSEGEFFVAVRVVAVPELKGVVQFMVVSNLSGAEAINMRGMLEESSNIILN